MYALPNKTQHKLIVKVRGGISQKLDNLTSSASSTNHNSDNHTTSSSSLTTTATAATSSSSSSSPFKSVPSIKESAFSKHVDETGFNAELNYLPQPIFHSIPEKHGHKSKSFSHQQRAQKQQFITPEHGEMIKYVQQSWKGVERDYKKSVNNFINNLDLNSYSDHHSPTHMRQKQSNSKKKTATTSTPLLLSGSYHHTSTTKDSNTSRQDSFQPFDLEAFWGNRILKRLIEEI